MTELEKLAAEIAQCKKCPLARGRNHTVPGEGPADAKVMFIGEAPGFHELVAVRRGWPVLEQLLQSIGMSR